MSHLHATYENNTSHSGLYRQISQFFSTQTVTRHGGEIFTRCNAWLECFLQPVGVPCLLPCGCVVMRLIDENVMHKSDTIVVDRLLAEMCFGGTPFSLDASRCNDANRSSLPSILLALAAVDFNMSALNALACVYCDHKSRLDTTGIVYSVTTSRAILMLCPLVRYAIETRLPSIHVPSFIKHLQDVVLPRRWF